MLVPLHTSPKAVEKELNALYDVFLDVSKHWQSKVGRGQLVREGRGHDGWVARPDHHPLSRT